MAITWLAVAVGGALGSMARHWVNVEITRQLGRFTTFSSFGLDTFTLGHGGNHVAAFWNVVGQVSLGVGGVWLGFYLGLSTG
jgi:fluoride ion exporter CrcB/FEX